MMAIGDIVGQLSARGLAAAETAVARHGEEVAAIARTELPGVAVHVESGTVTLSAPGLRARAFGTRRRAADPRVAGLIAMLASRRVSP